jgi:hypothetical protein
MDDAGADAAQRTVRSCCDVVRSHAPIHGPYFSSLFFVLVSKSAMKTTSLVRAVLALAPTVSALSSIAAPPRLDLVLDPAPATAAGRTIAITPDTSYVNVQGSEVVRFDVGGRSFAWRFDGPVNVVSFDLARVAPSGMLDHAVTAYVSPNPFQVARH